MLFLLGCLKLLDMEYMYTGLLLGSGSNGWSSNGAKTSQVLLGHETQLNMSISGTPSLNILERKIKHAEYKVNPG